jgi:tRNA(Ile)-lysidine synthase
VLKKFQKHIDNKFPYLKQSTVLIACSGGLDSTVLAYLFHASNIKFSLAHCNFNLRGKESDKDEIFVKNLGSYLNTPVYTTHFNTVAYNEKKRISIQMAARELRYDWFEKIKKKHHINYTLTGHHKDDVLETFLINFTRGTGLDGLTGIPEVNGKILRPLLPFTRKEIQEYAEKNSLVWREDESNSSTKYIRNKIRHDVVPILKSLNPNFFKSFDSTLSHLQDSQYLIHDSIAQLRKELLLKKENASFTIPMSKILQLTNAKANLYEILKPFGFTNWKDIKNILGAQTGKQLISKTHKILKNRNELIITKHQHTAQEIFTISSETSRISSPIELTFTDIDTLGEFNKHTAYLDKQKLKGNLIVRKWQKGDYFYPLGMKGKKKLSNYFKDSKLSLHEKEAIWILCDSENIVWIIGSRMDDRYKITKKTNKIFQIKLINKNN